MKIESNIYSETVNLPFVRKRFRNYKSGLIRKIRLISRSVTSQPGKQTITILILPNISRNKGNQAMKVGQLIEYYIRNIFLEKSYIKCGVDTIPRPFSKKVIHIEAKQLAFTSYKDFLRNKKGSGTSLPASLSV